MPNLQLSVPGQATTSAMSPASAAPRSRAVSSAWRAGSVSSCTQRRTRSWFCWVRAVPPLNRRMISARPRNCSGDRFPRGTVTVTAT